MRVTCRVSDMTAMSFIILGEYEPVLEAKATEDGEADLAARRNLALLFLLDFFFLLVVLMIISPQI